MKQQQQLNGEKLALPRKLFQREKEKRNQVWNMCKIHSVFEIFPTCHKFRMFRSFFLRFFISYFFFLAAKNKTCTVSLILFKLLSECWASSVERFPPEKGEWARLWVTELRQSFGTQNVSLFNCIIWERSEITPAGRGSSWWVWEGKEQEQK